MSKLPMLPALPTQSTLKHDCHQSLLISSHLFPFAWLLTSPPLHHPLFPASAGASALQAALRGSLAGAGVGHASCSSYPKYFQALIS